MSKYFVLLIILISTFFAILFSLFQHYELYSPINTGIFGDYGDFISGGLSVVSIYLLVETLKQQKKDSEEQQKSIEENNFNSVFFGLLRHLQKEIEDLNTIGNGGQYTNKDYFENLRRNLQEQFHTENNYKKNVSQAICDYVKLYIKNPRLASYFRLLYRICELTDKAQIEDNKKKEYVKILRAQLTGSELLLLRYSAQTAEGKNFKSYINKYNLLKHLPMFELLEFKQWWKKMDEYQKYQVSIFADNLKYHIKKIVRLKKTSKKRVSLEGWNLNITLDSPQRLTIVLEPQKNQKNNLFSTLSPENIQRLLQCILSEILSFSYFEYFRKRKSLIIERTSQPSQKSIGCYVESLDQGLSLATCFPPPKISNSPI